VGVGEAAASAYRVMRKAQHHARLNEEPTDVPRHALNAEREAVLALWHAVMG
jgi:glutamate-ammonia-ligase adenylyltransferase